MSFLYSIKDPTPIVLVGGISGVGKTSIISFILKTYPNLFSQPISYTSREKRDHTDRYSFKSKEEITLMHQNGHLFHCDEVYGELYGISKKSVKDISKSGKIPIKEVHPNNFYKFREKVPSLITVVIENTNQKHCSPHIKRQGRPLNEKWQDENNIDIKINISGLNIEEASVYFLKRIYAFRKHLRSYPHPNIIDNTNLDGYSKLAVEFDDDKRVTTKNFHDVSKPFWDIFLSSIENVDEILELGVGNGWLFSTFVPPTKNIYGLDISENMEAKYVKTRIVSSSRNTPFQAKYFSAVVGSLADPFLYPEAIIEISRILKSGGYFAFTYPSLVWATNLTTRIDNIKTTFITNSGENIEVFSLCRGLEELSEIFYEANFEIVFSQEYYIPCDYKGVISRAITDSAINYGEKVNDLPVLIGCVIRKK